MAATDGLQQVKVNKGGEKPTSEIIEGPWVPGMRPPDSIENPECGDDGHHCITPGKNGVYRPDWVQVYINAVEGDSSEVFCPQTVGDGWLVRRGQWVDVPKEVVDCVSSARFEITEMPGENGGLKGRSEKSPTRTVPRYAYSVKPSA